MVVAPSGSGYGAAAPLVGPFLDKHG